MPMDCYRVQVLYYLNPHLIWVEVRDPKIAPYQFKFEQIGIYGLLPLETTINLEEEEFTVQRCKEWQPAASSQMHRFLENAELWFTPIHIDTRSSIFDSNIHKFGDLLKKNSKGATEYLSKELRSGGFATFDACLFHTYLSEGKIVTKLDNNDTKRVIKNIENFYKAHNPTKKNWEKPIKAQTSVFHKAAELEAALTASNLTKHNEEIRLIIENKNRDFELCKDLDEKSVGRGTGKRERKEPTLIERKLLMLNSKKSSSKTQETTEIPQTVQAFKDAKNFLEANATPYPEKIEDRTNAQKAQILKKIMCKNNKTSKQEPLGKKFSNESKINGLPSDNDELDEEEKDAADSIKNVHNAEVLDKPSTSNSCPYTTVTDEVKKLTISKPEKEKPVQQPKSEQKQPNVNEKQSAKNDSAVKESKKQRQEEKQKNVSKKTKKELKQEVKNEGTSQVQTQTTQTQTRTESVPDQDSDDCAPCKHAIDEDMVCTMLKKINMKGPKHNNILKAAIKKCKEKKDRETLKALQEFRRKIVSEIKESQDVPNYNPRYRGNRKFFKEFPKRTKAPSVVMSKAASMVSSKASSKAPPKSQSSKSSSKSQASAKKPKKKDKPKPNNKGKKDNSKKGVKTAYGPPGLDLNKLNCRVPPIHPYGDESTDKKSNSQRSGRGDVTSIGESEPVPSCSYDTKRQKNDKKASVWEKRLKLHKEMSKSKRNASQTPDTTNKDTSISEEKTPKIVPNVVDESDESVCDGMDMSYQPDNTDQTNVTQNEIAVYANPFQNMDVNLSDFVDQLVTPIMMVHSKMNRRFTPNYDFNFSDHIHQVLKNCKVQKPMMIQTISWAAILRGYSTFMVGAASCGKTMGYVPAVCRLVGDYSETYDGDSVGPISIILCATAQSVSEVGKLAKLFIGIDEKIVTCYYGHDEKTIAVSLLNGCHVLICTAPSLVRLMQIPELGVDLRRLLTFVLDDCERLYEVYGKELKYCFRKIRDMLKKRVNKELKVQYIVASRIWCDFMEPLAKKAPDTVVCINAFQECVLYSKANMTVSYVKTENKFEHLCKFLEEIETSKRTVIVCDTDDEVDFLYEAISNEKFFVFAVSDTMTVQELYNMCILWKEFSDPDTAPLLVCRDSNLYHMNLVDAQYLVQYSMPSMYSTFCRRFATLNESYPSIFKIKNDPVKILIMLDETNMEQLPKIVNFVKRCTNNVPEFLDDICKTVLEEKDIKKGEALIPLCNNLLNIGYCASLYNCDSRHTILKACDTPKDWLPRSGEVKFNILHFHSATHYSVRLMSNYHDGKNVKYPQDYSSLSVKMGFHYSKEKNKKLLGIPKVGDICAVALRKHLFSRCQVIKIVEKYERGDPRHVLINLFDEGIIDVVTDTDLYYLPNYFKGIETYVVNVTLANVQPRDRDVVFSELALNQVKSAVNEKENIYLRGRIALTVANTIFVDTLEVCQDLKSLKETVVTCNVKQDLLEKHAEVNDDHMKKLEVMCQNADIGLKPAGKSQQIVKPLKPKPEVQWAHIDDDTTTVFFQSAEDPETFFVRLTKFDECLTTLIKDIQTYVAKNTRKLTEFIEGDIILAEYPDDSVYERARIQEVDDSNVKCFFVDQGECQVLTKNKLLPINEALITRLPFQTIECRLVGIKPPGKTWTDFATNWLFDKCFESKDDYLKILYLVHFTKEKPAEFTGGFKYGVVLIDTSDDVDVVINQTMIDLNLAKENEEEMKYLDTKHKGELEALCKHENEDDWEKVSQLSESSKNNFPANGSSKHPIQSVLLMQTDDESEDSDKWQINMNDDIVGLFKQMHSVTNQDNEEEAVKEDPPKLLPKDNGESCEKEQIDMDSVEKNIEQCLHEFQLVRINPDSKELDSDALTASKASVTNTPVKIAPIPEESRLRKPKVNWRQTKYNVMMKIHVIGVETYDIEFKERSIKFAATVNDTEYGFEFDLYGIIDSKNATHSNKGLYILAKFNKILTKKWLTLTKDGGVRKWIVYDVDWIDTASEEEEVLTDNLVNIVKNIHNKPDSDSDDDFVDDVNFTYKRD